MCADLRLISQRNSSSHRCEKGNCTCLARHLCVYTEKVFVIIGVPATVNTAILHEVNVDLLHLGLDLH